MAKLTVEPQSFPAADQALKGKDSQKIGNNTWLERRGDNEIAVRLHGTDVVTFHRSGRVEFRTGGWNTMTTMDRLNAFAPAGVKFWITKGRTFVRRDRDQAASPMPDVFVD